MFLSYSISGVPKKLTSYAKRQKNQSTKQRTHTWSDKYQKPDSDMAEILELSDWVLKYD